MIPFKAGSRKFSIPTDWSEITLDQSIRFMQMSQELKEDEQYLFILSVFTGMTIDECRKISLFDVKKILMPLIGFLNQPVNQDELMNRPLPDSIQVGDNIVKKFYSPGQMTWAQHLNFDNIITDKGKTDIEKMPDIIAVCIQKPDEFSDERIEELKPDILKMSLFDSFAIAGYYMREIKSFYEKANMKDTTEYTAEQIRAGIKEFSKFGAFNSIDTLAGGDITKWDRVVQLPMADVIIKLKMNQQHYKYETKYNEIMTKKK